MKIKKIIYLGGLYQAEYSMKESFIQNGIQIAFLYDELNGRHMLRNAITNNCNIYKYITEVKNDNLKDFLKSYKPDVVIHRYYKNDPFMFPNSSKVCKELGIPFCKLLMETDDNDNTQFDRCLDNCDFILYAHDIKPIKDHVNSIKPGKWFFYPYGVGPSEKNLNIDKINDVSGYGYLRTVHSSREENIKLYLRALKSLNVKLNVYYTTNTSKDMNWDVKFDISLLNIHNQYQLEQTTEIMNQTKIAINFESVAKLEGAYSHKMFQTMGCGIPIITFRKKCLEDMFGYSGENLIFIENEDEAADWISFLLRNDKFRINLGNKCEKFIHEHYDWYKRFNDIMISVGIWKK